MPAWLTALLAALPQLVAEMIAIIQAANGSPTPPQMAQLAAYSAAVGGINQALAYHAVAGSNPVPDPKAMARIVANKP